MVVDDRNGKLRVACTDGYVLLEEIQLSGKKRMGAAELLRECISQLDKAAKLGVIHRNKASNKKSQLMLAMNSLNA